MNTALNIHNNSHLSIATNENDRLILRYKLRILSQPLTTGQICFDYLLKIWNDGLIDLQEQTYLVFLDKDNQVIAWHDQCKGTDVQTDLFIKLAMGCAVICQASKIILAHNHPGQTVRPSIADINVTGRLIEAAKIHDIQVYDHLIITRRKYFSFRERELI